MVSYASNWEDVLLDRLFPRDRPGLYVDVGAGDPIEGSATKHFYDLGWRGVNVESARPAFEQLTVHRARDRNVNAAVSDHEGTMVVNEGTVPVTTLARICEQHVDQTIDFLVIGPDGEAGKILSGADFLRWRPRVLLLREVESLIPAADQEPPGALLEADYLPTAFNGTTRFYVRREDAALLPKLSVPVSALDDFVPYAQARRIDDLSAAVADIRRAYGELDAALAEARAGGAAIRAALAESASCYEQLRHEVTEARAAATHARDLLSDVGPTGLGLVRRLGHLSRRFPRTSSITTSTIRALVRLTRSVRREASNDAHRH